jgi:catechol 2,3-dioxygenase-like lactoylglutathione lyase family enzyme
MIGYVCLGTNDLDRATRYYDALLAPMGAKMLMDFGRGRAWGTAPDKPMVSVIKPFDGQPAQPGNGMMTALMCNSHTQVDAQYQLAITLGGTDEGPAGPRGEGFYAGYVRDLDGNKLCFCCFG